jgi:hypothetical protein
VQKHGQQLIALSWDGLVELRLRGIA